MILVRKSTSSSFLSVIILHKLKMFQRFILLCNWNIWNLEIESISEFYSFWFQEKLPPGLEDFTLCWTLRMPKTIFLLLPLYQNISPLLGPHFISTYKFSHSYFLQASLFWYFLQWYPYKNWKIQKQIFLLSKTNDKICLILP